MNKESIVEVLNRWAEEYDCEDFAILADYVSSGEGNNRCEKAILKLIKTYDPTSNELRNKLKDLRGILIYIYPMYLADRLSGVFLDNEYFLDQYYSLFLQYYGDPYKEYDTLMEEVHEANEFMIGVKTVDIERMNKYLFNLRESQGVVNALQNKLKAKKNESYKSALILQQ